MQTGWKRGPLALVLALALLVLLESPAAAEDASQAVLPPELTRAAPEAAALLEEEGDMGLLDGAAALWEKSASEIRDYLLAGVQSVAALLCGVVVLGAVESLTPDRRGTAGRGVTLCGALWVTAVSAGDLEALMGLGRETVTELSQFSKVLTPVLASATALGGGVTGASVRQLGTVLFSDVLLTAIDALLLPAVYLYVGLAAAGTVLEGEALESAGRLLKKAIGWVLGGLLLLFTTYLTVSGAVAGAVDARAVKLAKTAIAGAVPVVGGILSEAAESVLAGAGVLRAGAGVLGTLAVLALCLTPFLRLGIQYLLYQGAAVVAAAAGPGRLTRLIAMLGDAFGLVLAMTGASAVLLLVSLLSSLTAVLP